MSPLKRRILIGAVTLFVFAGCYPPWVRTFDRTGTHRQTPAGYSLIFLPPSPEDNFNAGVRIDITRLSIEWVLIASAASAALLLSPKESRETTS